MSPARLNKLVE